VSATFFVPRTFATRVEWTTRAVLMEGACECLYVVVYVVYCKILDVSLKLDGIVFDRFNIDLIGVEIGIRELLNDEFDRFRLDFGSSPRQNVSFSPDSISIFSPTVFSTICFKSSTIGIKCLSNAMSSSILPALKA